MFIKKIRIYSLVGADLGGLTFIVCHFYSDYLMKYLNVNMMMGILTLIAATQGLLASLVYRKIKE